MWLLIPLIMLAGLVVLFGVAIGALVALAIKLLPALLILAGAWLLVRAIFGSGQSRRARRQQREWERLARHGGWHGQGHGWQGQQWAPAQRPPMQARARPPAGPAQTPTPAPVAATPPPPPPRRELPIDVQVKVDQIKRKADMLLEYADRFPPFSQDLHIVRQTAADYLPRTVEAYLRLPLAQDPVVGANGKTALDELKEQLSLLDSKLDEIAEALQKQDVDRMLANRRFLEERFRLHDESSKSGEIEAA